MTRSTHARLVPRRAEIFDRRPVRNIRRCAGGLQFHAMADFTVSIRRKGSKDHEPVCSEQ